MHTLFNAFQTAGRRTRMLLALALVTVSMFGMLVFEQATAEPASAHNRVCKVVTVPQKLPWYQCVNLGTMPAGSLPAGCYATKKTVCS